MLDIITFINKFGYAIIENATTITRDIQENGENFSRALQALHTAYSLRGGRRAVKEYLSVWEIETGHSKGYLIDELIVSMCHETHDFIADLNAQFYY